MHLVVDALGLPVDFEVTEGQRHESVVGVPLVQRVRPRCLLADKGFDTNPFRMVLQQHGCVAVIPCQGNRVRPLPYDRELYKARALVECAFNLLKQARRFATSLREDAAELRGCRRHRLRAALAANLNPTARRPARAV